MIIGVLGANGALGRHLTPQLGAAGWRVRALVRRPEAAGAARACGAEIAVADIFDEASMVAGLRGCDIAINIATSLPGPSGRGDFAANDRLRRDGTPIWVEACRQAGVSRLLQQSIAMINAAGDAWANEDTPYGFSGEDVSGEAVRAARDMEAAVAGSDRDWAILRGGLYYGPGTGFDDDWFARAKAGRLRLPKEGRDYVSLVHINDMASAIVAAVRRWPSQRTLIVSDDEPAQWRDVFGCIAEMTGADPPSPGGRAGFPSFRVSNARAKDALGWTPAYPNFRVGLAR